jgi:hypothetical protein
MDVAIEQNDQLYAVTCIHALHTPLLYQLRIASGCTLIVLSAISSSGRVAFVQSKIV